VFATAIDVLLQALEGAHNSMRYVLSSMSFMRSTDLDFIVKSDTISMGKQKKESNYES